MNLIDNNNPEEFKSNIVYVLQNYIQNDKSKNNNNPLSKVENYTQIFLKEHNELIFTRTDKGNAKVVMNFD